MTVLVKTATLEQAPDDWESFVASDPLASVYHRSAWMELIRTTFGHPAYFITARDGAGSLVGVLPLVQQKSRLFGNFLTSIPFFNYGGPLCATPMAKQLLMEEAATLARALRARHVELRTQAPEGFGWRLRTDKVTMMRELPTTLDALGKELGSKLRSQIKRAEREQPRVNKGGIDILDKFYYVFSRNMRDLGTPVYPLRFFRNMLERFPECCHIVCVELRGEPAAAGFLITSGDVTEIPWASCTAQAKPLGANMRLYWECLGEAINRGSARFDFGRSSVDAGTYRFKLQWGAKPIPLYWHYWLADGGELPQLNSGNSKMALAIKAWQKMPLWLCEALGPHIVKNLP